MLFSLPTVYIFTQPLRYGQDVTQGQIGFVGRVFANGPGDLGSIPGRVIPKTLEIILDSSLLNTQQYKVLSRVKWSNPGKGVAPSPTRLCSSYWKGSLLVALDYSRQLYLLIAGLNSEFSFSWTGCHTKAKEPSLPYYLPRVCMLQLVNFVI